jgi:hypothetical protein
MPIFGDDLFINILKTFLEENYRSRFFAFSFMLLLFGITTKPHLQYSKKPPKKMWAIYFYYLRDYPVGINDHSANVTSLFSFLYAFF